MHAKLQSARCPQTNGFIKKGRKRSARDPMWTAFNAFSDVGNKADFEWLDQTFPGSRFVYNGRGMAAHMASMVPHAVLHGQIPGQVCTRVESHVPGMVSTDVPSSLPCMFTHGTCPSALLPVASVVTCSCARLCVRCTRHQKVCRDTKRCVPLQRIETSGEMRTHNEAGLLGKTRHSSCAYTYETWHPLAILYCRC